MDKIKTIWAQKPAAHDYGAAEAYLTLLFKPEAVKALVRHLRRAPTIQHAAKDILRAAKLPILKKNSLHVAADLRKIRKGKKMSPVLLIAGDAEHGVPLTIADGYHRICASWYWEEDTPVSCCLVELPKAER